MEILIGKGTYRDKFYMLNPFKQREVEKWREKVNKYDIIRQNKSYLSYIKMLTEEAKE